MFAPLRKVSNLLPIDTSRRVPRKSRRYPCKYFNGISICRRRARVPTRIHNVRFNIQIISVRINRNVKLIAKIYQISLANRGSALERTDVASRRDVARELERTKERRANRRRSSGASKIAREPHPSEGLFAWGLSRDSIVVQNLNLQFKLRDRLSLMRAIPSYRRRGKRNVQRLTI